MLYASSRLSLIRGLGSLFTDSIFATSEADLTSDAYAAHLRHVAAPNPLSFREQEFADLCAAESAAIFYKGSQKQTHVGTSPGFHWTQETEDAVVDLGSRQEDFLLILVSLCFFFSELCACL
jgi:twinfilin-like protein